MALTLTVKNRYSLGNRRGMRIQATGTNASGGTAVTPGKFGLTQIEAVLPEVGEAGKELVYDRVAGKISLFDGGTEDTSTDVTNKSIFALVIGY